MKLYFETKNAEQIFTQHSLQHKSKPEWNIDLMMWSKLYFETKNAEQKLSAKTTQNG